MEIRPLGPVFGAEVTGIQLAHLDDAQFEKLRALCLLLVKLEWLG